MGGEGQGGRRNREEDVSADGKVGEEDAQHGSLHHRGVLVIDKHEGITSMTVCSVVRGKLRAGGAPKRIKVGHGGTLDPLATGVLVVLVGKATKMCEEVMQGEKEYVAEVDLSRTSTTDDREGETTEVAVGRVPMRADVEEACRRFVGVIQQTPPVYSAMKVGGERAYKVARRGGSPEMKARPVEIHALEVVGYAWPVLKLHIRCGKGTYIRSLARDLGAALGCGGMLVSLRRTRVGRWRIEMAKRLDELPERLGQGDLDRFPISD